MLSEGIFVHYGTTAGAASGQFGAGVYQQVAAWALSLVALLLITPRYPRFVSGFFSGQFKWISFFALLALLSVPISVSPKYSFAWSLKLILVVLLLRAVESCLDDHNDVIKVFQILLLGILGLAISRFAALFLESGPAFRGGRLEMIAGSSGYGGLLLALVLINWRFRKNPWLLIIATFGLLMMLLAGGKAAILATVVAVVVFFLSINRARYALAAVLFLSVVFSFFVAFTPLGHYLEAYNQSGQASNLTGRVDLWKTIWPEILAHPIMGHGYLASRFLSVDVAGVFPEAGQTHNSLLEPLYNNGVLGLSLILIINFLIVRNLIIAMKDHADPARHYMAAGIVAIYADLFIWGMFTATPFGGQPNGAFMTFLEIFIISTFLARRIAPRSLPQS
jgi:O-antigen ligase